VPGLELIGPERLHEIEPYVSGIKALFSPTPVIDDSGQVAGAFARL